ncbi:glycosyltransferase family 4 protein [Paenibacillus sp. P25]|nr:glycosyltransferase family 4 protein [Paenibacillus sp. P25]
MKIMLFSHLCAKQAITGAEKYLLTLARELGHHAECTLVVPEEGVLSDEAAAAGVPVVVHPVPLVYSMFNPSSDLIHEVEERLRAGEHGPLIHLLHLHQPDLVIVNTCLSVIPAAAAKKLGIPVAWFITEKIMENSWSRLSAEVIGRYADWIIGISETTLRPLRDLPHLGGKLHLLPPTWRMEDLQPITWPFRRHVRRSELGIAWDQPVIGYVSSSIYMEKGLEHFITMGVQVASRRPDVHFLYAGNVVDKDYFQRCLNIAAETGLSGRFRHIGFDTRIENVYPAMDIVVVPSLIDEGFGLTAMEGSLFGKSVVAYRSGGLGEILQATGNADLLAEKGDIDGLAARVLSVLHSGPVREAANREAVQAAFGIDTYRRRLLPLVERFKDRAGELKRARKAKGGPRLRPGTVYRGSGVRASFCWKGGSSGPSHPPKRCVITASGGAR